MMKKILSAQILRLALATLLCFAATAMAQPVVSVTGSTTFANTPLGGVSSAQAITIKNTGSANLSVTGVTHTAASIFPDTSNGPAPNATHYCGIGSVTGGAPSGGTTITINPGGSCILNLVFKPNAVTAFNATITINSNATPSPTLISLSGAGITALPAIPGISSPSNASGALGQAFSYQIVASNSPSSFAANGLPAGLTVNATTGSISGTPTVSGNFSATISATNASGTATQPLNITILVPTVVSTVNDSGPGSLRDAINFVNANCNAQTIGFAQPGVGPHNVKPLTALPAITCAGLTIDGYTQSGALGNTNTSVLNNLADLRIVLDGSDPALQLTGSHGLVIAANNVTVRGLAIRSFPGDGIHVTGSNAVIVGNYIGTDPGGANPFGNGGVGVRVNGGVSTQIGDGTPQAVNLITGNVGGGVIVQSGAANVSINFNILGGRRDGGAGASGGHGIDFSSGGTGSFVLANRIHGYAGSGVNVSAGVSGIRISQNRILFNAQKGIANAGNSGIQRPTITTVAYDNAGAGSTSIAGSYVSLDNSLHKMEFFENPATPSVPSGENLFNTALLNPTATGSFSFADTRPGIYKNISLTLRRDVPGDTSEFSNFYLTPLSFAPALLPFSTSAAVAMSQVVTVTNTSNAALSFSTATISGSGFSKGADTCSGTTLAVAASCNVTLSFLLPTATTSTGSAVFVVVGGGVTTSFTTPLTGTTTAAALTSVTLSAAAVNFGVTPVGQFATPNQTVTVTNSGANNLVVSGILLAGASVGDFAVTDTCFGVVIAPAGSCIATVSFKPSGAGVRSAQFALSANTAASPHIVTLSGSGGVAPTITSGPAANGGTVGVAYSHSFVASGTPSTITWSFTTGSLPPGITLNSISGVLSGTPTTPGNYAFVVVAANGISPNAIQTVSIAIAAAAVAPTITSAVPPASAVIGTSYSHSYSATGSAPITWSVTSGALPAGISLNASSGLLSGLPTLAGSFSFTVQAANGTLPNATQAALITIAGIVLTPVISSAPPPANGSVGVAYTHTYTAAGTAPFTWALASGTLPTGLTLNATTGVLSGTPSVAGSFSFGVQAANAVPSAIQSATVVISLASVAPTISSALPIGGTVGSAYSHNFTALGTAPIVWTVASGSLPPGLVLNGSSGALSGTPSLAGGFSFAIQASNGTRPDAVQTVTLSVAAAIPPPAVSLSIAAASVAPGTAVALSVTITNPSALVLADGAFSLTYPQGLITASPSGISNTCGGTVISLANSTATIGASGLTLPANSSCTIRVNISSATINNYTLSFPSGGFSGSTGSNNTGSNVTLSVVLPTLPAVTLNPNSLNFGARTINTQSPPQTVTLSNSGAGNLTIATITGSGDFGFTTTCPLGASTLAANASCVINITFTPLTVAALTGRVTIASDAPGSPHVISLIGSGSAVAVPGLSLSATALVFSAQTVNTTSATQTVVVGNSGFANLLLSGVNVSPPFSRVAVGANDCASSLAPGSSCLLGVAFTPTTLGEASGQLSISSNAVDSPHTLSLTGSGTPIPVPVVTASSAALAFGDQIVNTTSGAQSLTFTNSGSANLIVSAISVSGSGAANFAVTGQSGCGSILPTRSCTLSITFTPTTVGNKTAQINLTSNAQNAATGGSVNLSGSGILAPRPIVGLTSTAIGFGNVIFGGATPSQVLTLTNSGGQALSISNLGVVGDFVQTNNCGSSLAALSSCTINIAFTPLGQGVRNGELILTSNAGTSPSRVLLGGTGCRWFSQTQSRYFLTSCGS